jgi:hypothetical protein
LRPTFSTAAGDRSVNARYQHQLTMNAEQVKVKSKLNFAVVTKPEASLRIFEASS